MRERLEEYVDGLLSPEEARVVEEAVARDPELAAELERVRKFAAVLAETAPANPDVLRALDAARKGRQRRRVLIRVAVAAALLVGLGFLLRDGGRQPAPADPAVTAALRDADAFGRRLGEMALVRRAGRVPRIGLGKLEQPTSALFGRVFTAALKAMDVDVPTGSDARVQALVRAHFRTGHEAGPGVAGECRRAESALETFRALREAGGAEIANAFYDVFRPGLADLKTARRVASGTLVQVVGRVDPDAGAAYLKQYKAALERLHRRYGVAKVALVLAHLAPDDSRAYWRDAAQDGVGRDAVLVIRARVYRAARDTGVDRLYIDVG